MSDRGPIVVGIDGGGSKTRVVVANAHGKELGSAEGPGSAVRPGAADKSAEVIAELVRAALADAKRADVQPQVLCVGVAGVGDDTQRQALIAQLEPLALAAELIVVPDATVALDDAFGDGAGVLLIAGTGSVAFGRGPSGEFARCGGWGPVFGDEGSGSWIGRRALGIAAAAADGREAPTALLGAVLTAAQANEPRELIAWAAAATPGTLATLAPAVLAAADSGDRRADTLLAMAAEELVLHVRTLARALFLDERAAVPVALAGGLLARGSALRRRVEQRMKSAVPGAQLRTQPVDPARGAVKGALKLLARGEGRGEAVRGLAPG